MRHVIAFITMLCFAWFAEAAATGTGATPTTQPVSLAVLEMAANTALQQRDYATALTIFQKAAERAKDDPERLDAILGKIRVCKRYLKEAFPPPPPPRPITPPPDTQPARRKPHVRPAGDAPYELAIQELGNFPYDAEKGGGVPDDVLRLDGARVRLRGYMIPLNQAEAITEFALVPSLLACCFGQPPQIQHTIVVYLPRGKALPYVTNEIVVEGALHVREKKDDGFVVSLFELKAVSVKTVPAPPK
jgi:hypothetical protein